MQRKNCKLDVATQLNVERKDALKTPRTKNNKIETSDK